MTAFKNIVSWLLNEELSAATVLGFLSIPFMLVLSLSTGPSHYTAGPVLFAGALAGLYYHNQSTSAVRAGLRTGVIGGLSTIWTVVSIIASGWAISFGYAVLGVAFSVLWLLFAMVACGFFGVVGALIGTVIGYVPPFRRIASEAV